MGSVAEACNYPDDCTEAGLSDADPYRVLGKPKVVLPLAILSAHRVTDDDVVLKSNQPSPY